MRNTAPINFARAIVLWGLFFLAPNAEAQSAEQTVAALPEIDGAILQAGFRTTAALSGDWQSVDIFAAPNANVRLPNGRPWIEYAARRLSGERGGSGTVTWATSRDCPALYNTLVWLTVLVAPRIEIAGVSPNEADPAGRRPVTLTVDGLSTTVWGFGTQPDHALHTRVEMTSNGGLVAEFGRAATRNLMDCWTPERPQFSDH